MPIVITAENAAPESKVATIILCSLGFVGISGLHRFYTGHILSGLLWFFTGGLLGIGTIIDLVLILTNAFRNKRGGLVVD